MSRDTIEGVNDGEPPSPEARQKTSLTDIALSSVFTATLATVASKGLGIVSDGEDGSEGAAGERGPAGEKGERGETGPQGPEGRAVGRSILSFSRRAFTASTFAASAITGGLTPVVDVGMEHPCFNPETGTYTADRDELLCLTFSCNGQVNSGSYATKQDFIIRKNGSNWLYMTFTTPTDSARFFNVYGNNIASLRAGDVLDVVFRNSQALAQTIAMRAHFIIERVQKTL